MMKRGVVWFLCILLLTANQLALVKSKTIHSTLHTLCALEKKKVEINVDKDVNDRFLAIERVPT